MKMTRRMVAVLGLGVLAGLGLSCSEPKRASPPVVKDLERAVGLVATTQRVPAAVAEFRGIWMASVENINWPSRMGMSASEQQEELRRLYDRAVEGNFNAVVLQVRPAGDALYESALEPWSVYLTGVQGKSPGYDPLAFAVAEAHARGLEIHAWINPFRVRAKGNVRPASANSLEVTRPEWVRDYTGLRWLDPGEPGARAHSLAVIDDIVRRYDLDGIHIDDYFYPYPDKVAEFPDDKTYAAHGAGMSRGDWRRANINDFVRKMYAQTKAAKPWVKVGISPFGIWRPGNPKQIQGFDAYERLYADSRLWMKEGWGDYFSPQLYWTINRTAVSFPVLLGWWSEQNTMGRHLWPGLNTTNTAGKGSEKAKWPVTEIEYQIRTARGYAGVTGTVHFSAAFLAPTTRPLAEHLKQTVYEEAALVPASPWLVPAGTGLPGRPGAVTASVVEGSGVGKVRWGSVPGAVWYVVQYTAVGGETGGGETWRQVVVPASATPVAVLPGLRGTVIAVSAVDRYGRVSPPAAFSVGD